MPQRRLALAPACLPALALAAGLAACAPATPDWTAPGVGAVETDAAWSNCQRLARERAGYGDGMGSVEPRRDSGAGLAVGPLDAYDRERADRTYRRTLEACMRAKGFVKTDEK